MDTIHMNETAGELKSPVRNRYFYGKMLDVFHLELEQDYFNEKRWLLNQRVIGYGVICGLEVVLGQDSQSVIVQPGIALDRCGHEIIVACPSAPVSLVPWMKAAPVPPAKGTSTPSSAPAQPEGQWLHVCLCYHECETDPVPAFGGDCDTNSRCSSGAIRERYKIDICPGKVNMPQPKCNLSDVFANRTLDYAALVRHVMRACVKVSDGCCIAIANIYLPSSPPPVAPGQPQAPAPAQQVPSIDNSIRPIVLTNTLLFQLMLCLCGSGEQTPCSGNY
jgi:hypothetical protein